MGRRVSETPDPLPFSSWPTSVAGTASSPSCDMSCPLKNRRPICEAPTPYVSAYIQAEPLGLVYDSDNVKYGIEIIDISDLDTARYGIVAAGYTLIHIQRVKQWEGHTIR